MFAEGKEYTYIYMNFVDTIENKLGGITSFTPQDREYLLKHVEQVSLKKGQFLIRQGESESYLYMINRGIIRYWTYNTKDEESTFWFTFPGDFSFSAISLHLKIPSEFNAQAIEDCLLSRISYEDLYQLFANSTEILKPAMIMTVTTIHQIIQRDINFLKLKPSDRYAKLLKERKEYVQQIPLKYLASYLGITPQALSRIRRKIN